VSNVVASMNAKIFGSVLMDELLIEYTKNRTEAGKKEFWAALEDNYNREYGIFVYELFKELVGLTPPGGVVTREEDFENWLDEGGWEPKPPNKAAIHAALIRRNPYLWNIDFNNWWKKHGCPLPPGRKKGKQSG